MIIRLALFLLIISLILFTTGCCQLGPGVTSLLEEMSSSEEIEPGDIEDDKEIEEEVETDSQEEEVSTPISDVPCWIVAMGGDGRDYAPSLVPTEDGYVAVGMTTSYGLGTGTNNLDGIHDFMAVRLNKKGELIWSTVIGGPEDERGSFSVTPTKDEGFILTGTTRSYGSGNADIFVVKLDAQGGLAWARAIGGAGQETGKTTLELNDGYMTVGDTS